MLQTIILTILSILYLISALTVMKLHGRQQRWNGLSFVDSVIVIFEIVIAPATLSILINNALNEQMENNDED